jgi:phosphoribosylformylglycinamidine synthase
VVKRGGEVKADLPIRELGDEAPLYDRPWVETPKRAVVPAEELLSAVPSPLGGESQGEGRPSTPDRKGSGNSPHPNPLPASGARESAPSIRDALLKLLASPNGGSKRWVYEQYDSLILGNTVQGPGGDAAVIRLGDGPKGLALTTDVNERYCEADPFEGGKQAVAEAWRNLVAVGAKPLALTDNLNFGNPEKAEAMGQLVLCIRGVGKAARALDFPIVSGNVSLYNETMGRGILPTPAIGGVGLVADVTRTASIAFRTEGDEVLLIGGTPGWLGCSSYAAVCCGREDGAPPPVDLALERRHGDFIAALIAAGRVSAVHDVSDGGFAVAVAEMAMAGGIGAQVVASGAAYAFGEDQGRYVIAASLEEASRIVADAAAAKVPVERVGVTGGTTLVFAGEAPVDIAELRRGFESFLPKLMERPK